MKTILVTGFGPFPGAPVNPTERLVAQLSRKHLSGIRIVPHVFRTGYADVDRDLPKLIAQHRPHALLMFGLAAGKKAFRVETNARNSLSKLADATGNKAQRGTITPGGVSRTLPSPARPLHAAARASGVPVILSRDAGDYLCNYLCWRAIEASKKPGGPRLATFIHVPEVHRGGSLLRAGSAILSALARRVSAGKRH